jgi:predicted site-specific integrase-resolvase
MTPWTPSPDGPQPGAASDSAVAKANGVSRFIVLRYRKAHGIPGIQRDAWKPSRKGPQPGKATDTEVAEANGVDRHVVLRYRRAHGIPAQRAPTVRRVVVTDEQVEVMRAALAAADEQNVAVPVSLLRALLA